jgi:RNA polymerase sigma factor (sigma-70 family)
MCEPRSAKLCVTPFFAAFAETFHQFPIHGILCYEETMKGLSEARIHPMTDAELVGRILSGEERLFEQIVERHMPRVWALCASYVRNRTDCEDIAQQSFIQCYRRLDSLRDPKAFMAWLGQLTRRECLGWLRASSRRQAAMQRMTAEEAALGQKAAESPEAALAREEVQTLVHSRIDTLPPKYREALYLYYTGGHSVAEAADFLGITRDAMKKRLELGRKKIREGLTKDVEDALTADRPQAGLKARVLAAIPFGQAAWLTGTGLTGTTAATTGLTLGGGMMLKATLITLIGGLGAAGLLYGAHTSADDPTPEPPAVQVAALPASADKAPPIEEPAQPPEPPAETTASTEPKPPATKPEGATPAPRRKAKESKRDKAATEKKLDKPVSIEFQGEHIGSILQFVSDYVGINAVLDQRVVVPENTAVDLPSHYVTDGMVRKINVDCTLIAALDQLLHPLGLDFVVEPGFVWISTPAFIHQDARREPDARYEGYDTEAKLDSPVRLEFANEHLQDILRFANKNTKVDFVLDYRVIMAKAEPEDPAAPQPEPPAPPCHYPADYITDGTVPYISLKDIKMRDMLKALLRPLNLTYDVRPGYLWISTASRIQSEPIRTTPLLPESRTLASALDKPVSIEFETEHVASILGFIADYVDIRIAVDAAVVAAEVRRIPRVPVPRRPGLVTDGTVPYISLKDLPLRHALDALLLPLNLTFATQDDTLWVSAEQRLQTGAFEEWGDLIQADEDETTPSPPAAAPAEPSAAQRAKAKVSPPPKDPETVPAGTVVPPKIILLKIRVLHDGSYLALLRTYTERWCKENEQLLRTPYKLQRIDPDEGSITVVSEKLGTSFTFYLPETD